MLKSPRLLRVPAARIAARARAAKPRASSQRGRQLIGHRIGVAPAVRTDVALHHLARLRLHKERAGGAHLNTFRGVLIFRLLFRHLVPSAAERLCGCDHARTTARRISRIKPRFEVSVRALIAGPTSRQPKQSPVSLGAFIRFPSVAQIQQVTNKWTRSARGNHARYAVAPTAQAIPGNIYRRTKRACQLHQVRPAWNVQDFPARLPFTCIRRLLANSRRSSAATFASTPAYRRGFPNSPFSAPRSSGRRSTSGRRMPLSPRSRA